jgi:hypothetical protein
MRLDVKMFRSRVQMAIDRVLQGIEGIEPGIVGNLTGVKEWRQKEIREKGPDSKITLQEYLTLDAAGKLKSKVKLNQRSINGSRKEWRK